MDEASAFLATLERTAPRAPTACTLWTAHELVAHLAAGAAEMAELVEARLAGLPERATREFGQREAPYRALPDDELRTRLVEEALRLSAAVEALGGTGPSPAVLFSGRRLGAKEIALHGRSEAAIHRWDLAGDDDAGHDLLGQAELTTHTVSVLNAMLDSSAEAVAGRVARAGIPRGWQTRFGASGQPDVVLEVDEAGARLLIDEACPRPTVTGDPAARLLALWGRRSAAWPLEFDLGDPAAPVLAAWLWGETS
jgi:hypothetical protein